MSGAFMWGIFCSIFGNFLRSYVGTLKSAHFCHRYFVGRSLVGSPIIS